MSNNSPEIETCKSTSSFVQYILMCILVTVNLGLKSLGVDLGIEMLRVEMSYNHLCADISTPSLNVRFMVEKSRVEEFMFENY